MSRIIVLTGKSGPAFITTVKHSWYQVAEEIRIPRDEDDTISRSDEVDFAMYLVANNY